MVSSGIFRNLNPNCYITTKVANFLLVSLKYNMLMPFTYANLISNEEKGDIYAVFESK